MKNIISFFPKEELSQATSLFRKAKNISFSGAGNSSSKALIMAAIFRNEGKDIGNVLWVVNDGNEQNAVRKAIGMWSDRPVFLYKKRGDDEKMAFPTVSEFERTVKIEKLEFLSRVYTNKAAVFVVDFQSLLQDFPNIDVISKEKVVIKKGQDIDSVKFIEDIVGIGYEVTDYEALKRGQYYRVGDSLFIYPVNGEDVLRLRLIREQIVSYVNRYGEDALEQEVIWRGEEMELEEVLPELEIRPEESADTFTAKVAKLPGRILDDPGYAARRGWDYIWGAEELEGGATVREGLYFEEGFSGGGEHYEGGTVVLRRDKVHPSASLFTIEREEECEAIVVRFDPAKGARFVFEVQVGATTRGSGQNLAALLKRRYGNRLMMDTVGSMVHGRGMPISMIFEDGEPQNKKTTREGRRDGLVMFNQRGRMEMIKKSQITYTAMARLVNMAAFERGMRRQIEEMEERLYSLLPEGADELSDEVLRRLKGQNPDLVRDYSELRAN